MIPADKLRQDLIDWRNDNEMSQKEFSRMIGKCKSFINKFERGKLKGVSYNTGKKIEAVIYGK